MVLAGSNNGMVCLTHSREMLGRFVALWNPSINIWKSVSLLEPKSEFDVMERMSVGLGFDSVADDFRIIRIVPVLCPPYFKEYSWSRVEIYWAKCLSVILGKMLGRNRLSRFGLNCRIVTLLSMFRIGWELMSFRKI